VKPKDAFLRKVPDLLKPQSPLRLFSGPALSPFFGLPCRFRQRLDGKRDKDNLNPFAPGEGLGAEDPLERRHIDHRELGLERGHHAVEEEGVADLRIVFTGLGSVDKQANEPYWLKNVHHDDEWMFRKSPQVRLVPVRRPPL
jgi:hypothetical protein